MDDEACPSPVVRKYEGPKAMSRHLRSRIPKFQQSKRGPKAHAPTAPVVTVIPAQDEDRPPADEIDQALTMREASFDQQRAELRKPPSPKPETGDVIHPGHPRNVSDSSVDIPAGGLCRSSTPQCWRDVKATVTIRPRPASKRWLRRPSTARKTTPTRNRDAKSRRSVGRVVMPSKAGLSLRARPRYPVSPWKQLPQLPIEAQVSGPASRQSRRPTPVASLRGMRKASTFSEECRDMLNRLDFDRDWLLPGSSYFPTLGSSPLSRDTKDVKVPTRHAAASPSANREQGGAPIPDITLTKTRSTRPVPPTRVSSKTIASLAALMHMKRTRGSAVALQGVNESSLGAPDLSADGIQGVTQAPQREQFSRMPSATSTAGRPSMRSPWSALSTDTMSKIEAQVRNMPRVISDLDLRRSASLEGSDTRKDSPPSIPPERPLPALPGSARLAAHPSDRRISLTEDLSYNKENEDPEFRAPLSMSTIHTVDNLSAPAPLSSARLDTLGSSRRLSTTLSAQGSLRSNGSRSSLSSRSFNRHTISGTRADRVREMRMRDMASSRSASRSPSDDPVSSGDLIQQIATPAPESAAPTSAASPDMDQLDQFPAVPLSRPTSLVNPSGPRHTRGWSQGSHTSHASHGRNLSKTSPMRPAPARLRQALDQSNIFVVVDSDPITARFRAGAMSPTPSIGGSMRSASPLRPMRHARAPSGLREMTVNQPSPLTTPAKGLKAKSSLGSLKEGSLNSARADSVSSARKTSRSTRSKTRQLSSSSENSIELSAARGAPMSSLKSSARPQKRRRWNSSDISLIKTLHRDLEEYYGTILKQEEKIRWQADQIQMMIRVIAPMNRIRGVRTPYVDDVVDSSTGEEDMTTRQFARKISSGAKANRQQHVNFGSPVKRMGKAKPTRSNVFNPAASRFRADSTDNNSTASATGSTDSDTKPSADDASMTDPVDYEPSPSATFKVVPLIYVKDSSRPSTRDESGSIVDAPVSIKTPLHHPPPVAALIPHGPFPGDVNEGGKELHSEGEKIRDTARLSVNHVLTSTEQMDRAIEQLLHFR